MNFSDNDAGLVSALMANDENAIEYVFYDHYNGLLHYLAKRQIGKLPIEYDDMLQDFFMDMSENNWEKIKKYDPNKSKFDYWFSMKANGFFRDYCRKWIYNKTDFNDDNPINNQTHSDNDKKYYELRCDLLKALETIQPPRDRKILRALLMEDSEPKELAKEYNTSRTNIDTIKKRKVELIRNYLSEYLK